jgi:hypothetical protein
MFMQVEVVAAGFMPAFNYQDKFAFEIERGLKARGYVPDLYIGPPLE